MSKDYTRVSKNYMCMFKADMFVALETRFDPEKLHKQMQKLGFDKLDFFQNKSYSEGIVVSQRYDIIEVEIEIKHFQFIHMKIKAHNGIMWYFTPIYASLRKKGRRDLWDNLLRISYNLQDGWLLGQDFNDILLPTENKRWYYSLHLQLCLFQGSY